MSSLYDSTAESSSNRSRYGIDKLREGNFVNWKWNCQALLEENEVWDYVTGDNVKPVKVEVTPGSATGLETDASKSARKAWDTKDRKAMRIIGFTVTDELQGT